MKKFIWIIVIVLIVVGFYWFFFAMNSSQNGNGGVSSLKSLFPFGGANNNSTGTIANTQAPVQGSNEQTQIKCADFIITYATDKGVTLQNNSLNSAFNYILRRWYDKDKRIAESFEYFQFSPPEIQKEISLEVINFFEPSNAKETHLALGAIYLETIPG